MTSANSVRGIAGQLPLSQAGLPVPERTVAQRYRQHFGRRAKLPVMHADSNQPAMADHSSTDHVERIGRLGSVPTILQTVAHTTGLRFAAIARITDTSWTACAMYDAIDFGLKPGDVRSRQHASAFSTHPVPKQCRFESHISIPIFRADGKLFGTLCALDPLYIAAEVAKAHHGSLAVSSTEAQTHFVFRMPVSSV